MAVITWAVIVPSLLNALLLSPIYPHHVSSLVGSDPTITSPSSTDTLTSAFQEQYKDVVTVVGGGLAGLLATLETLHLRPDTIVVLLESLPQFGGRVYNVQQSSGGSQGDNDQHDDVQIDGGRSSIINPQRHVEIGATFIHGIEHNPLYALANRYRIPTRAIDYDNFTVLDTLKNIGGSEDGAGIESTMLLDLVKSNVYDAARRRFFQLRNDLVSTSPQMQKQQHDGHVGIKRWPVGADPSVEQLFITAIKDVLQTALLGSTSPSTSSSEIPPTPLSEATIQKALHLLTSPVGGEHKSETEGNIDVAVTERLLSWHFFWEIVQDQIATLDQLSSFAYDASLGFRGADHVFSGPSGIQELIDKLLEDIVIKGGLHHLATADAPPPTPVTPTKHLQQHHDGDDVVDSGEDDDVHIPSSSIPMSKPIPLLFNVHAFLTPCAHVSSRVDMLRGGGIHTSEGVALPLSQHPRVVLAVNCPIHSVTDQLRSSLLSSIQEGGDGIGGRRASTKKVAPPSPISSTPPRRLVHRKDAHTGGHHNQQDVRNNKRPIGLLSKSSPTIEEDGDVNSAAMTILRTTKLLLDQGLNALRVYDVAIVSLWMLVLKPFAVASYDVLHHWYYLLQVWGICPLGSYLADTFLYLTGLATPTTGALTLRLYTAGGTPLTSPQLHSSIPMRALHSSNLVPIFLKHAHRDEIAMSDRRKEEVDAYYLSYGYGGGRGGSTSSSLRHSIHRELLTDLLGPQWGEELNITIPPTTASTTQFQKHVISDPSATAMDTKSVESDIKQRKQRIQRRKKIEKRGRDRYLKGGDTSFLRQVSSYISDDIMPQLVEIVRRVRLGATDALSQWWSAVQEAIDAPIPTQDNIIIQSTTTDSAATTTTAGGVVLRYTGPPSSSSSSSIVQELVCSAAIITIPLGALKQQHHISPLEPLETSSSPSQKVGVVQFDPPLPTRFTDAVASTGCSETLKLAIQFDISSIFWPSSQFFGIVAEHPHTSTPSKSSSCLSRVLLDGDNIGDKAAEYEACRRFIFGDSNHIEIVNMHALRGNGVLIIEVENDLAREWSNVSHILQHTESETAAYQKLTSTSKEATSVREAYEHALVQNHVLPTLQRVFVSTTASTGAGDTSGLGKLPQPIWYAVNNYVSNPYLRCGFSYWRPGRSGVDNVEMSRPRWSPVGAASGTSTAVTERRETHVASILARLGTSSDKSHIRRAIRRNIPLTTAVLRLLHGSFAGSDVTGRLLFAGEHTTAELYGNMHGAIVEGQRAAVQASLQIANDRIEVDGINWVVGLTTGWGRWRVEDAPLIVRIWLCMTNAAIAFLLM